MNPLKSELKSGKVCIGLPSLSFPCPAAAQISAEAGYHYYYFDMEHSGLPIEAVAPICTAAKAAGIPPIGGPAGIADFLISRLLDNGAMGVIVPHVSTPEETQIAVKSCLYSPEGDRGFLMFGPLTDFRSVDAGRWVESMNEQILVGIKVESAEAVRNIQAITSTPGLDAVMIGPGDLSASLGVPGRSDHPDLTAAIERIGSACERNGLAWGLHVSDSEALRTWTDRGATFMTFDFDGDLMFKALRANVNAAASQLGNRLSGYGRS